MGRMIEDDETEPWFYRYLKVPSATLSVFSSAVVLYHVNRSAVLAATSQQGRPRRKPSSSFRRLLSGVCIWDMISSVTLLLEFASRMEAGYWSCTMTGYFKVIGVTLSSTHNAWLSLFYYLVICRSWKDAELVRRFELPLLLVSFFLAVYWTFGIFVGAYNPGGEFGCWAIPYPSGCVSPNDYDWDNTDPMYAQDVVLCTRGDPWGWVLDLSTSAGFIFCVSILLGTNTAIYRKIRRTEERRQSFEANRRRYLEAAGSRSREFAEASSRDFRPSGSGEIGRQHNSEDASRQPQNGDSTMAYSRIHQTAIQSFLYCSGYLFVYSATFLHAVCTGGVHKYNKPWYPFVRSLQEVTFPLHGVLIFLVYFRPRYVQWQQLEPNFTHWETLKATLSGRDFPQAVAERTRRRSFQRSQDFSLPGQAVSHLVEGPKPTDDRPEPIISSRRDSKVRFADTLEYEIAFEAPDSETVDEPPLWSRDDETL